MNSVPAGKCVGDTCIVDKCIVLDEKKAPVPTYAESIGRSVVRSGENSLDPFPVLDRLWDIYSGKGIRTVFVSVGTSRSCIADLEIAESLGCPIHCVALTKKEGEEWDEVASIVKERKRSGGYDFSAGAELKWVLPKNLRIQKVLPWWANGTVDISGESLSTQSVSEYVAEIATNLKLKDNITRIDILKIDTQRSSPGLERGILGAVLNAGFRPALILVRWTDMPDVHLSATISAGHLQNCGYSLVGKEGNKFLYYFSDDDMYQICSWEGVVGVNPLFHEIVNASKTPVSK